MTQQAVLFWSLAVLAFGAYGAITSLVFDLMTDEFEWKTHYATWAAAFWPVFLPMAGVVAVVRWLRRSRRED